MKRAFALGLLLVPLLWFAPSPAADDEEETLSPKEALQALNDFIGDWKGSGTLKKNARETWKEQVSWTWRFKGKDVWLSMAIHDGKYFQRGQLRYLPDKKRYQFKVRDADGQMQVYLGTLKKQVLTLQRFDKDTKEAQQIRMNVAGDGVRFVYRYAHRPKGRTIFYQDYEVAFSKEGESLGVTEKTVECIVTGGVGKIPVVYKGVTYYVCCTGCRDAFNENPEKILKEAEARKKKN